MSTEEKRGGKKRWLLIAGVGIVVCICGVMAVAMLGGTGSESTLEAAPTARPVVQATEPAATPEPEATAGPTHTPAPTDTAAPTATATQPPPPTSTPAPVLLSGRGQMVTDPFLPPTSLSRASFTHDGSANFIVTLYQGDNEELLINEIGPYRGARPIIGDQEAMLEIDADGAWTVEISGLGVTDEPAFSGRGSAVSDLFDPPDRGPWEVRHDGQANFIVMLYCAGGMDIVQNEIGPVTGSIVVRFPSGPCFWDVQADGQWSLAPR